MATREAAQAEIERLRIEQGQQFLAQMKDMFQQTRTDLSQQFVPQETHRRDIEHVNQAVERVAVAVEKLTNNVGNFHENASSRFADRAETKQDIGELHTEIEKLKTARETDMQRGYDYRFDDMRGRYKGDMAGERGWRQNAQQQATQVNVWLVGALFLLISIVVPLIVMQLGR